MLVAPTNGTVESLQRKNRAAQFPPSEMTMATAFPSAYNLLHSIQPAETHIAAIAANKHMQCSIEKQQAKHVLAAY